MHLKASVALLLLLLACTEVSSKLDSAKVLYSIDVGSPRELRSAFGYVYTPDQDYSEGSRAADYTTNDHINNQPIKYTYDPKVYLTERHADESFSYDIPVDAQGTYVLILQFAELYFDHPGQRKINIKFGDDVVVRNLDIVEQVGKFAAYEEYIQFELKEKEIWVNGKICNNAYNYRTQRLKLTFEKTEFDLPKVDGILLFEGELSETDYKPVAERIAEWQRQQDEEERIREIERRREERSAGQSPAYEPDVPASRQSRGVIGILTSGPGLAVLAFVAIGIFLLTRIGGNEQPNIQGGEEQKKKKKWAQVLRRPHSSVCYLQINSEDACVLCNVILESLCALCLPLCLINEQRFQRNLYQSNSSLFVLFAYADISLCQLPLKLPRSCLLYTSPSPRDGLLSRMPSSA
eukprot:TRINITY_DN1672_c0_g1_i1.p1 TRINITY_DN1672_c0_g1~~TRINITY_DN1672_c0_g1_i1.p1  ORF type:complete len:407 (+),score=110.43 TRINITY_DN1672_c0_g1_i1:142-1362(+)